MKTMQAKRHMRFLRCISAIVLCIFTCTTIAWSAPPPLAYKVQVPSQNGKMKERWKGDKESEGKPLVIHIQDAHTSLEAQENIAAIINHFVTQSPDDSQESKQRLLVCAEGAEGICDTDLFSSYPDQSVKEIVSHRFMEKGKFTGSEYQSIISDKPFDLFGAESRNLYLNNYQAYLAVLEERDTILSVIQNGEAILNTVKNDIFSEKLKRIDDLFMDYKKGITYLIDHIIDLFTLSQQEDIELINYPNLFLFYESIMRESAINHGKVIAERDSLIELFKKKEIQIAYHTEFQKGEISEKDFFTYLKNLIIKHSLSQHDYRNFVGYTDYLELMSRVDIPHLLQEAREVRWDIEDSITVSFQEKVLIQLRRTFEILTVLVQLQALYEDVTYFYEHRQEFTHEHMVKQLRILAGDDAFITDLFNFNTTLNAIEEFYSAAHNRNSALVDNTLQHMSHQSLRSDLVLLIAGGYHTNGITEELREQNVPYVVITPHITKVEPDIPYEDRMLLKLTPFESLINNPAVSTIAFQLLTARKPLINWWDDIAERVPPGMAQREFDVDVKLSHEQAVILALYLFGFMRFVVGDDVDVKDIPKNFYSRVTKEQEDQFKQFLIDNNWEPVHGLYDKISFAGKAKDGVETNSVIFTIEGKEGSGTITLNVGKFLTDFDTALRRGGEVAPEEIVVKLDDKQLTTLYQTILKHLTIALPTQIDQEFEETTVRKDTERLSIDDAEYIQPARPGRKVQEDKEKGVTRRDILKGIGLVGAAVAAFSMLGVPGVVNQARAAAFTREDFEKKFKQEAKIIRRFAPKAIPATYQDLRGQGFMQTDSYAYAGNVEKMNKVFAQIPGARVVIRQFKKDGTVWNRFHVAIQPKQTLKKAIESAKNNIVAKTALTKEIVDHIIQKESQGDALARSAADAFGMAQVKLSTIEHMVKESKNIPKYKKKVEELQRETPTEYEKKRIRYLQNKIQLLSIFPSAIVELYSIEKKVARRFIRLATYLGPLNLRFGMTYLAFCYNELAYNRVLFQELQEIRKNNPTQYQAIRQYLTKIYKAKDRQKDMEKFRDAIDSDTELLLATQLAYNRGLRGVIDRIQDMGGWHALFSIPPNAWSPTNKKGRPYLPGETANYGYQFIKFWMSAMVAQGKRYMVHPDSVLHLKMVLQVLRRSSQYKSGEFKALLKAIKQHGKKREYLTYNLPEVNQVFYPLLNKIINGKATPRQKQTIQKLIDQPTYEQTILAGELKKIQKEKHAIDIDLAKAKKQKLTQRIQKLNNKRAQKSEHEKKLISAIAEAKQRKAAWIPMLEYIKTDIDEKNKLRDMREGLVYLQKIITVLPSKNVWPLIANVRGYVNLVIKNEGLKEGMIVDEEPVDVVEPEKVEVKKPELVEEKREKPELPTVSWRDFVKPAPLLVGAGIGIALELLRVRKEKIGEKTMPGTSEIELFKGAVIIERLSKQITVRPAGKKEVKKSEVGTRKRRVVRINFTRPTRFTIFIAYPFILGLRLLTNVIARPVIGISLNVSPFGNSLKDRYLQCDIEWNVGSLVFIAVLCISPLYVTGQSIVVFLGAFLAGRFVINVLMRIQRIRSAYLRQTARIFFLAGVGTLVGTVLSAAPAIGKVLFDTAAIEAMGSTSLIGMITFFAIILISLFGAPSDEEPLRFGGRPISKEDFDILKDMLGYLFYNMYVPEGYTQDESRTKFKQAIKDKFGEQFYNEKLYLDRDNFDIQLENKISKDGSVPLNRDDCLAITVIFKDKMRVLPEEKIAQFYIRQVYDETDEPSDAVYIDMSESFIAGVDKIGLPSGIGVGTYMRKALMTGLKQIGYKRVISQPRARTKYIIKDKEWGLGLKLNRVSTFYVTTSVDKVEKARYYLSVPSSILTNAEYQIKEYYDHFVYLVAPEDEDEFDEEKFIAEIQAARAGMPQFIVPFKEPVYVFINDDVVTDDTVCDFDGVTLNASNIYPVFFSFTKMTHELILKLEKMREQGLVIGRRFSVMGKDGIAGDDAISKFKNMIMQGDFDIRSDNRNVIVIDNGSTLDNLSLLLTAVHQNDLGWIGPVNPEFSFRNINKQKQLIKEGRFAATIMAGIQFIVKHKIIERKELTAANNVQEGILPFQGSVDELRVWQEELMAKLNELEKQAIIKKAA